MKRKLSENEKIKILNILDDKLGLDMIDFSESSNLRDDMGVDSLDEVELIMEFEKLFTCVIPDSEAKKVKIVSDIYECIESCLIESNLHLKKDVDLVCENPGSLFSVDDIRVLSEKFKDKKLPDSELSYSHEAEIWSGIKSFIRFIEGEKNFIVRRFLGPMDFDEYMRLEKPENIWLDEFSEKIPFITIDNYVGDKFQGRYNGQGVILVDEISDFTRIFKEGMYVKY